MNHFFNTKDVTGLNELLNVADRFHNEPLATPAAGQGKTVCLLFFNPSLRTRLSSIRAAENLGMKPTVLDVNEDSWKLEFEDGTVMDGDKAEHIREAAAVIGAYYDVIAVRAFAGLKDREKDYAEQIFHAFRTYSGVPVINLESSTGHPLQALADLLTIRQHQQTERPKVVLTWAPHPRALPQAVANSFAEWMRFADMDLTITHPEGYELDEQFTGGIKPEYDQMKALKDADFVYAKNWSSFRNYGKILSTDPQWQITGASMARTNNAKFMHCLPVRRNVIVADEVLDSPASLVIPQAKNRIVAMQTVLALTTGVVS